MRFFAKACLELDDEPLPVSRNLAPLVELLVEARAHRAAVRHAERRVVGDARAQNRAHVFARVDPRLAALHAERVSANRVGTMLERVAQRWKRGERLAQRGEIAREDASGDHLHHEALEVANRRELLAHLAR